ncbi:hypothetical protein ACFX11_007483 [Malus domestica]
MQQPPGFIDPSKPYHVCKLSKSLYGLKQALRAWYDKLFQTLVSLRFQNSQSDCSLFVVFEPSLVIVLIYVDDTLVTRPNAQACKAFIHKLSQLFPVKDLGPLHYFLGLEVHRSSDVIFLSQHKYAMDLLLKTYMDASKPCNTPLGTQKLDHSGTLLSNPHEYRSIVGALQYLTWTRPDLSFVVNQLCQFLHETLIFNMLNVSYVFLKALLMTTFGLKKVLSLLLPSRMLIGLGVCLIDNLQVVTVFILATTLSVRVPRNNTRLLAPLLKLNIVL